MRPTLTVVGGGGQPEPDADTVAHAEEIAAAMVASARAGFGFWIMLDGDPAKANCSTGNALEMAALAEEIARDMKCALLGLGE